MSNPQRPKLFIGNFLTELLATKYKPTWLPYEQRRRNIVNTKAVARVLAAHIEKSDGQSVSDVELKRLCDKVSRALNQNIVQPPTLKLFVEAFAMDKSDEVQLFALLSPVDAQGVPQTSIDNYTILSSRDVCVVNASGVPTRQETMQIVRAGAAGLSTYAITFDTDSVVCETILGRISPLEKTGPRRWTAHITRPLAPYQTGVIKYAAVFNYSRPHPYFARTATRLMRDVSITVVFQSVQPPQRILRTWQVPATGGYIEERYLPRDNKAHCAVEMLQDLRLGFRWE
ncbi:MAG TPA: hypothetical protein VLG40_00025 [Candidatus Saccharimonas sp.]|nr:hypothetical protein [Candidatus Saccharimonas sp.]